MPKKILIVDNSIHKKCDRCGQFHRHFNPKASVIHSIDRSLPRHLDDYSHVILTGSAASVDEMSDVYEKLRPFINRVEKAGVPLLGICYGFQAIVAALSDFTSIEHYLYPEIGWTRIYIKQPSVIFKSLPKKFYAFENHLSSVRKLPSELISIASSYNCQNEIIQLTNSNIFGTQFHPELSGPKGLAIINKFITL